MLILVLRRARVQRSMLAAVVGLVAVAACLVGVCALLLSVTQDRAFQVEVERAQPSSVDVTAYLVDLPGSELPDALSRARSAVTDVMTPMRPTVTASAFGPMRRLTGDGVAYLATDDAFSSRAVLTAGRWPRSESPRPEVAIPAVAAGLLGLHLGDSVTLGQELDTTGGTNADQSVTVVVVGTFEARLGPGWETDPLSGEGYLAAWAHGATSPPAYGPFVLGDAAFRATGSYVDGLRVTAHPTLALARRATLDQAAHGLDRASALLTDGVGSRVEITRVASELPQTLSRIHAQQSATRSTVLVVMLLGVALSVAAALLAGWLVASRRDDERALLVTLGLSRRQQLTAALTEAGLLAAAAAVLAVPAAALVHGLFTRLPALRAAGLAQRPTVTLPLVASVLASSLLLTLTLVITALDAGTATDRSARHRFAIRRGLDVLLVLVAAVCWWQLRTQSARPAGGDVVLTVAPMLCLASATLLLVRLVPAALGLAARMGARARGLVAPLAAQQAARRPHHATAMVTIAGAIAVVTFGLGVHATWERSQSDQAALLAGTDASLTPVTSAGQQSTAAVEAAQATVLRGHTVSPVVSRPLALGSFVGTRGSSPVIVGMDATHAGALLRGRLDGGRTWSQVGAQLAPTDAVRGIPLPPGGTGIRIVARAPARAALRVTPTAVLQDEAGIRSSLSAGPVPMDGRAHPLVWAAPIRPDQRLVGVQWQLAGPGAPESATVSIALHIPMSGDPSPDAAWHVHPTTANGGLLTDAAVSVASAGSDTVVRTSATAALDYFGYSSSTLLVTAFPTPTAVPVAASQDLVDAVGARSGTTLDGVLHGTAVRLRVVAVVPDVPSAPGQPAVLADMDSLTRALIGAGDLDPGVDAWWISDAPAKTVRAVQRLALGDITTRSDIATGLADGPLRVAVPTALLTLVGSAGLLLLASVALLLASDRPGRSEEVSRLRALGLTAGEARRLLLVETTASLLPLALVGALAGAATSAAVGPALIRSDVGGAPVPAAIVVWPWGAGLLLVSGLTLGALAISAALTAVHVRASDPVYVRTEGV